MPSVKMPQPYALRIERIRAMGYSATELLHLLKRDDAIEKLAEVDAEMDWENFLAYASQHGESMQEAVLHGYRFSYLTFGGLKSLLGIRYKKEEGRDYIVRGNCIEDLALDEDEVPLLQAMLPEVMWEIAEVSRIQEKHMMEVRIALNTPDSSGGCFI